MAARGGEGGEGNKGDFGAKVGDFGQKGAAWRENERFPVGEGGFFGRGLGICGLDGALSTNGALAELWVPLFIAGELYQMAFKGPFQLK